MRLLLIFTLVFVLSGLPAWAEDTDASIYEITDVKVDVTAASAAKARDQAVIEAQHNAFHQMLERIGARASSGATFSDDDIAALVQSFEVQDEHTSSVRYIGTFTVQFKPNAIRTVLSKAGISYVEARGKLAVVLPVYGGGTKPVLWEDNTKWRSAWEKSSPMNGLVPVVVPVGDADDINVLGAEDAVAGKSSSVKAMIDRYQAAEAITAILQTNLDKPNGTLSIEVTRFDNDGEAAKSKSVTVAVGDDKSALDMALADGVKQVRNVIDSDWREQAGGEAPSMTLSTPTLATPPETTARLPVSVPIKSLTDWELIKRKLDGVSIIARTDVITLARGSTSIEIEFRGDVAQLQNALKQQNLSLVQNIGTNAWILQSTGGPL